MLVNDVKAALRISAGTSLFDVEITDLIEAAEANMIQSGIAETKAKDRTDPLIKRAIIVYCKANFGFDNPDVDRLNLAYQSMVNHLSLAGDYRTEVV